MKWVYFFGVDDFEVMINIGKGLCGKFVEVVEIKGLVVELEYFLNDGICKWVVDLG